MSVSYPHDYTLQNMDVDHLWKSTLGEIELEVSRGQFASFFKGTHLEENNGKIVVVCPNPTSSHMLQGRFAPLVKSHLEKRLERSLDVDYQVEKKPNTAPPSEPGPLFSHSKQKPVLSRKIGLNPRFTFESFAVSESNQMAFAAAQAVSNKPGDSYNPLFLWGSVGVGKTHLMQAIGERALQNNPELGIIYCTGEEFTNGIIEAIRARSTAAFKKKYRSSDLLMVDDIQFIAGRESVQMEFFHTFNSVLNAGGQIVLTSDRPPYEIEQLEARLRSRFEGGLTIDISPPNFELRTAILLIKANEKGVALPMDTAKSLAAGIEDTRALEGALLRYSSEQHGGTTGQDILSKILSSNNGLSIEHRQTDPQKALEVVAGHFDLKTAQLVGSSRKQQIAYPRHILMYVLRQEMGIPLKEVGVFLGGRDHSTIIHGVDKIQKGLAKKENIRSDLSEVRRVLWG